MPEYKNLKQKIMSRSLKIATVVALAAVVSAGVAFAWWSKPVTVLGNQVKTASIELELNRNPEWDDPIMTLEDMAPGTFAQAGAAITNKGKMPFVATVELTSWPGDYGIGEVAIVKLWKDENVIYEGTLKALYQQKIKLFTLKKNETGEISYRIELPTSVDNVYQDASISDLVFTFTAFQPNDPTLETYMADYNSATNEYAGLKARQSYGVFGFTNNATYTSTSFPSYQFVLYDNYDATTWMTADRPDVDDPPFSFPW